MRMIVFLFGALSLAACATQPEIRGAELDALAEELIQYAADHTDLEPLPPPRIEFVEDVRVAFEGKYPALDATDIAGAEWRGTYEFSTGIVWLENDWRPTTFDESLLLHELVHYLQHVQGKPLCREDLERTAYDIQRKWLNERGYGLPDDWGHSLVLSGCK